MRLKLSKNDQPEPLGEGSVSQTRPRPLQDFQSEGRRLHLAVERRTAAPLRQFQNTPANGLRARPDVQETCAAGQLVRPTRTPRPAALAFPSPGSVRAEGRLGRGFSWNASLQRLQLFSAGGDQTAGGALRGQRLDGEQKSGVPIPSK